MYNYQAGNFEIMQLNQMCVFVMSVTDVTVVVFPLML